MTAIEQLQQIGLNKYEAEAYYTLLAEGSITGYELGKRSQVPLSKSYEVLERLAQKGLALVQPGDPPRYMAEDPNLFLGQVRQGMTKTLDDLAISLATIVRSNTEGEFWVLRGRQKIFARAKVMVSNAQRTIHLALPSAYEAEFDDNLVRVSERGCQIVRAMPVEQSQQDANVILILADERVALAGTLTPTGHEQAVISSNQAIVTALSSFFEQHALVENAISQSSSVSTPQNDQTDRLDWIAWEDRKQRGLWHPGTDNRVA